MLELALSTDFVPGSNLKGDLVAANWSFLLPRLELHRVVFLGIPPTETLRTLARRAHRVEVILDDGFRVPEQHAELAEAPSIRWVVWSRAAELLEEYSADLVVVHRKALPADLGSESEITRAAKQLMKPAASLYLEPARSLLPGRGQRNLDPELGVRALWLTPRSGEMRTAVPRDDATTRKYFVDRNLQEFVRDGRILGRLNERLSKRAVVRGMASREALLVGAIQERDGPPAYLTEIASRAGVEIASHRWGLCAPGGYASRKLVFFLFAGSESTPSCIVKITRGREFNSRLENEYQGLRALEGTDLIARGSAPKALFMGHEAGLAVVGESAVDGLSLRGRTQATPDCPLGRDALSTLFDLGAQTALPASGAQMADGLGELERRFVEIYRPPEDLHRFLVERIDILAKAREPVPTVFQHGDPGVWNVLVTDSGRAVFLDWESAEPEGLPLWDLFYFLRSYCMTAVRMPGRRARFSGLLRNMLEVSPLSTLLVEATRGYCDRIGLEPEVVEPLFYTCWMHRALKEATRRSPAQLADLHYFRLLRACQERRQEPVLRSLFSD